MEITEEKRKKEDITDQKVNSMLHTKKLIQKFAAEQHANKQVKPNLSRFDGIRFHLKTRGKHFSFSFFCLLILI